MTDQHPITPPPELVDQWVAEACPECRLTYDEFTGESVESLATRAAQWGADQELEACGEWLRARGVTLQIIEQLRAALAQPEPQSSVVAWCRSDDFNDAAKKKQSFSGWREKHPDCDLALCVFPVTAQPKPQGPTDEELDELFTEIDQSGESESWRSFARAVLTRWGRPATAAKPVPVQPEGRQGLTWTSVAEGLRCILQDDSEDAIQRVWQRSRILDAVDLIEANYLPIPVAERLPGPEDCAPWPDEPDANPWCWAGKEVDGGWEWDQIGLLGVDAKNLRRVLGGGGWTHWLPHHALPVPQQKAE